ncbi:MAG: vitamin B12 dependent methionine synthase [Bacillota bacterium]
MADFIMDQIPFHVDEADFFKTWHVDEKAPDAFRIRKLIREAHSLGSPKAVYKMSPVREKGPDHLIIGDVKFKSRVLSVNIGAAEQVYPFVATCGAELERWSREFTDPIEVYWIESIKEHALEEAVRCLSSHLREIHAAGPLSVMNPGSLPDWPLEEQKVLFALLGELTGRIEVRLMESFLMVPTKSISGIFFSSDSAFVNCQLCLKKSCPNRRAFYQAHLWNEKYGACCEKSQ